MERRRMTMRVLVTGATGYIAKQLLPALRQRYDLTLLDVRTTNGQGEEVEGVQVADLSNPDLETYRAYFRGVDAVVHLAFKHAGKDIRKQYYDERINIDMAYHVYQVSQDEGVQRVVVASSNHAADWYEHVIHAHKLDMVYPDSPRPLSDNYYGWAKEVYEHLGFMFATGNVGRALPNVQLRIGAPRDLPLERYRSRENGIASYKRDLGAYISERDLQQLCIKSIETPDIRNEYGIPFQVFYGISNNARAFWSITNARKVIGYAPEDDSEVKYADDIAAFLRRPEGRGRTGLPE
jgi:hypothetical protein